MINMNTHQATTLIGGTLIGKAIQFRGVSTDSRQDCTGKLFVALSGENFNGEDYCKKAVENGAAAILVTQTQDVSVAQLICDNTLDALAVLAKNWAKQSPAKIIAITGSNGKTTVKNMISSVFSVSNRCSATIGNLNNEIGVPLTLCNIHPQDKYAVIEMGAAKLGDISYLVSLVDIYTAVITNVSEAHIGRFETFENIIYEKGQIISALGEDDFAVLPIDNENFTLWKNKTECNVLSFGVNEKADISTDSIKNINLPIAGKHNQTNAACATAIAQSCGIPTEDIKKGLEMFLPEAGRLENLGEIHGNIVINDSYNANPQSVKAAIDVLAEYEQTTTLVLGDMGELGNDSHDLHKEIGKYAQSKNITNLLTIGKESKFACKQYKENSKHFADISSLKNHLLKNWQQCGTVLVKGSRSMHLEDLIDGLINREVAA